MRNDRRIILLLSIACFVKTNADISNDLATISKDTAEVKAAPDLAQKGQEVVNTDRQVPDVVDRQGRDYSYAPYYPDDEKSKFGGGGSYAEYPPSSYVSYKDEVPLNCPPSPLLPALGSGLNFILLKLGAIGIIKAFFAVLFFVFLLKIPLLLAKAAFFKAIILPAVIAPLMMLFSNGNNMMDMMMMMKPDGDKKKPSGGEGGGESSGRALPHEITQAAWTGFKLLLDSDKCAERMACQLAVYNNDSMSGETFTRTIKIMEQSIPSSVRTRVRTLRNAFTDGNTGGVCLDEIYPCQSPHLLLSHGQASYRIL